MDELGEGGDGARCAVSVFGATRRQLEAVRRSDGREKEENRKRFFILFFLQTIADCSRMSARKRSVDRLPRLQFEKRKMFFCAGILALCFLVCFQLRNLSLKVNSCIHIQSQYKVSKSSVFQDVKCKVLGSPQLFWRSLRKSYRVNGKGKVVLLPRDGVTEHRAAFINSRLTVVRNYKIKKLIEKNRNNVEIQRAIKYMEKVNETLDSFDIFKLKERFDALENKKSSRLCDGCFLKRSMYIPEKPYVNGELYRKFVGGVETDVIYNISNRLGFCFDFHA